MHTKEQFDKVLDLVGPSTILDTFARTAEGGIICSCGLLGGQWTVPDFDPIEMHSRNLYLTTFASGNVSHDKLQASFQISMRFLNLVNLINFFRPKSS